MLNSARMPIGLRLADRAEALFERLAPFHDQEPRDGFIPYEPVGDLATVTSAKEVARSWGYAAVERRALVELSELG